MHKQQHDLLFSHAVRPHALRVLKSVAGAPSGLSLERIVIESGLPKSIVTSELGQLEQLGLVSIKNDVLTARWDTLRALLTEALPSKNIRFSHNSKSA
ncbi:helix-turn-helix domain-containing protein [Acaricomes phytoseiuli]|uniref:helix-turn-helix domain-containing protein n=1 Tax=Acaricomes phytoseiuli TaxID=291968 RepID=UPI000A03B727